MHNETYKAGPCGITAPHKPHGKDDWSCDGKTITRRSVNFVVQQSAAPPWEKTLLAAREAVRLHTEGSDEELLEFAQGDMLVLAAYVLDDLE